MLLFRPLYIKTILKAPHFISPLPYDHDKKSDEKGKREQKSFSISFSYS